MNNKNLI